MDQITKEMTIDEILSKFPQRGQKLAQEMKNAGLNCVGCGASVYETLEAGVLGHGYTEDDLEKGKKQLDDMTKQYADKIDQVVKLKSDEIMQG